MRSWWRNFKAKLLDDELFFRRTVRAGVVAVSVGAATLADQLATVGASPGVVKYIRIAGFVGIFVGLLIRNGEKNPNPEDLAAQIDAVKAKQAGQA